MPKINEYINTNPKPVETVYEIKNVRFSCSKHKGERVNSSNSFTYAVLLAITCKANAGNNNVDEKLMNDLIGHLHRNPWGI